MDTVILQSCKYGAETWALTKHQSRKLAAAQRSMERSILNISLRDKIRNDVIREKISERCYPNCKRSKRQMGWTHCKNEEQQMGKENIRMVLEGIQKRKRKAEEKMEGRDWRKGWQDLNG